MPSYEITHTCGHDRKYFATRYADLKTEYMIRHQEWQSESLCPRCYYADKKEAIETRYNAAPIIGVSQKQIDYAKRVRADALLAVAEHGEYIASRRYRTSSASPTDEAEMQRVETVLTKLADHGDARWILDRLSRGAYTCAYWIMNQFAERLSHSAS